MKSKWWIVLVVGSIVLPAIAQQGPNVDRPGRGRPNQPPREANGNRGPRPEMRSPFAFLRRLPEELGLTDEQRAEYDAILDEHQSAWRDRRGDQEDMRELAAQYREASRNGDTERAAELRDQMRSRGTHADTMMSAFLDDVATILTNEQLPKLDQLREEMAARRESGRQRVAIQQMMRDLPEALELTDEQRAQWDDMLAEQRAQMRQRRDQGNSLRPLLDEMHEARLAGDDARVAEIQAELEAARPSMPDPNELLDKLQTILTADQQARLTELRQRFRAANDGPDAQQLDPRKVLDAAKRLDLNKKQREQMKTIIRETQQARDKGPRDEAAQAALGQTVKQQILQILDKEQAAEFERLLQREQRDARSDRPERSRRGHEGRGHKRPAPPPAEEPGDAPATPENP